MRAREAGDGRVHWLVARGGRREEGRREKIAGEGEREGRWWELEEDGRQRG